MRSREGFTLVELLMAMLITTVGLLGLLKSMEAASQHNLKNNLRQDALLIAEEHMNRLKTVPFSWLSSSYGPRTVTSKRIGMTRSYQVQRAAQTASDPSVAARTLRVTVSWGFKNMTTRIQLVNMRSE